MHTGRVDPALQVKSKALFRKFQSLKKVASTEFCATQNSPLDEQAALL